MCELDKYACQTLHANFKVPNDLPNDITKIDILPAHDLLLAGFPCQDFSFAGQRKGFAGDRGKLFYELLRVIQRNQPKYFLLENVRMNPDIHKQITISLEGIGYRVFNEILNSKDFGVPQNRKRNFWVGFRKDIAPLFFQFPHYHLQTRLIDILEKDVDPKYNLSERYLTSLKAREARHKAKGNGFTYPPLDPQGVANTIHVGGASKEANLISMYFTDHTKANIKNIHQQRDTSYTWDTSGNNQAVEQQSTIRRLTPREYARLQGFPDSFKFAVSESQLYKQFGNAVTVPVITAILKSLFSQI